MAFLLGRGGDKSESYMARRRRHVTSLLLQETRRDETAGGCVGDMFDKAWEAEAAAAAKLVGRGYAHTNAKDRTMHARDARAAASSMAGTVMVYRQPSQGE